MSLFNSLITSTLPILPKWFAKPFARPYVAGKTEDDAVHHIRSLNHKGFSATVDILGEHVMTKEKALDITTQYCHLYDRIAHESLACNISIKPTHIGLDISLAEAMANFTTLVYKAKEYGNFLRIDMENSPFTDQTFEIYQHCKTIYNNVGVVIQSYLHRSLDDINHLAIGQFNSRICKGIYRESESIAFQDREEINDNYLNLAKTMLTRDLQHMIRISLINYWVGSNQKIFQKTFSNSRYYTAYPWKDDWKRFLKRGIKFVFMFPTVRTGLIILSDD